MVEAAVVAKVDIRAKMELVIGRLVELIRRGYISSCAISGGKDSSITVILVLEAIRRATAQGVNRTQHFITTSDTTVENGSILSHLHRLLDEIGDYCEREGLSVPVHIAKPSLAAQFVVSTIGRGSLPRTVENSVKDGVSKRACTMDFKILPQQRLRKKLAAEAALSGNGEIITILGTRYEESTVRASFMESRGENSIEPIRNQDGDLTFSPISDWTVDDVWEALCLFMDEDTYPFPAPTSARTIIRLHELYQAGNEGVCGINIGNGGNKSPCGSRFGCVTCGMIGDKDKSMESMIQRPEYSHLSGLSRFRSYLLDTEHDQSKRELIGRSLSKAGYIRVQGDVYSFAHRLSLLRMLLTLDVLEIERAERHEDDLFAGRIPDTEANRELCEVQFEMISPQQLVAIDFQWGMHAAAPHAFPAVCAWHDVRVLGRRYHVPELKERVQKVSFPRHGWFKVGNFDEDAPTDGLRSYMDELWNPYRHADRPSAYAQTPDGQRISYYEEDDQLTVDPVEACAFVTCSFDTHMYTQVMHHDAIESTRFWLNEGILKLAKGTAGTYQEMAVRGQYFANLAYKLNLTPKELDEYLIKNSISNAEHEKLLRSNAYPLFSEFEAEQSAPASLVAKGVEEDHLLTLFA
jgi:DNA sulfur modification protein DndC